MKLGHRVLLALAGALALGCAWGNAEWRRASYDAHVELRDAGDGRCSSPAPWPNFRACLTHDAPYELARRERCAGRDSPEHTSEQARFAADATLLQQMALDGYGELWSTLYYLGVRLGAWWTWHFGHCARAPPADREAQRLRQRAATAPASQDSERKREPP